MNNTGGRPRSLTDQKQDELIHRIGQGATIAEAAEIVGVSLRTVQREVNEDEEFAQDLDLARRSAPTDPYQLMLQAARTHWRAAAWLLERTDPERFGKRPPNSCRPDQVRDLASTLIEAMLQSVPAEQREFLDRRLQAVADKALEAILPYPRRCASDLATVRPTPLPKGYRDGATSDWTHHQPAAGKPESNCAVAHDEGRPDLEAKEVLSPKMDHATKPAAAELAAAAARSPTSPRGEVLSPEMHEASKPEAKANAAHGAPNRNSAANRKALHLKEREQARRARRQAARAKRKARKAA